MFKSQSQLDVTYMCLPASEGRSWAFYHVFAENRYRCWKFSLLELKDKVAPQS